MLRLLKDPFVHFIGLGLVAFLLQAFVWSEGNSTDKTIDVSIAEIERRTAIWVGETGREPSDEDIAALIQDYVQEEVLVREAEALGLDEGDTIIRRRLAQKMRGTLAPSPSTEQASEDVLRTYFEENASNYARPAERAFRHVYLNPQQRGQAIDADAEALRRQIIANEISWQTAGDAFISGRQFSAVDQQKATYFFGDNFANALFETTPGEWSEPIESAFGLHLVIVDRATDAETPVFDENIGQIREDYRQASRLEAELQAIRDVVGKYDVNIERVTPE